MHSDSVLTFSKFTIYAVIILLCTLYLYIIHNRNKPFTKLRNSSLHIHKLKSSPSCAKTRLPAWERQFCMLKRETHVCLLLLCLCKFWLPFWSQHLGASVIHPLQCMTLHRTGISYFSNEGTSVQNLWPVLLPPLQCAVGYCEALSGLNEVKRAQYRTKLI